MKLEEQKLNKSELDNFILQNSEKIQESLKVVIAELKQKSKLLRKETNCDEYEEAEKEADSLFGIAKFLKKGSFEKLMTTALLDKKCLRKKYNSADVLQEKRALYLFASHEVVKPIVQEFRNRYPDWKDGKDHLMGDTEKIENGQSLTDLPDVVEKEDIVEKVVNKTLGKKVKKKVDKTSKKKMGKKVKKEVGKTVKKKIGKKVKKNIGKKSLKRKNIEVNDGANGDASLKPMKKKRKIDSSVANCSPCPEGFSDNKGLKENQSDVSQNGMSKVSDSFETNVETFRLNRPSPWQKGREGKFTGKGNFRQNRWNRNADFRGRNGSWNSKQQSGGKQRKFGGKENPNNISVPADWQNKASSTNATEGKTDSLLKPSWLTNPEEHKPNLSYSGQRNFGRREPENPNRIRVSPDWKNKVATPKSEGQTTSLLRPDWLTSPQEPKPVASFNRSRGSFNRWRKR